MHDGQPVVRPVDIAPLEGMLGFKLLDEMAMPPQATSKRVVVAPLFGRLQRLVHLTDAQSSPRQKRGQPAATPSTRFGLADVFLVGGNASLFEETHEVGMAGAFSARLKRSCPRKIVGVGDRGCARQSPSLWPLRTGILPLLPAPAFEVGIRPWQRHVHMPGFHPPRA